MRATAAIPPAKPGGWQRTQRHINYSALNAIEPPVNDRGERSTSFEAPRPASLTPG